MKSKRILSVMIAAVCFFCAVTNVHATTISDLKKQKEEAQDQLDEINDNIDSMKGVLSPSDTSTTECHSHFGPVACFLLELLIIVLQ